MDFSGFKNPFYAGYSYVGSRVLEADYSKKNYFVVKWTQVKYTRNEWRRCKTTLETSGEDAKLHSKRVEKMK